MKSAQVRNYFWSVFSYIRTEYRKIRTRNNFVFRQFSRSVIFYSNNSKENNLTALFKIELPLLQLLESLNKKL